MNHSTPTTAIDDLRTVIAKRLAELRATSSLTQDQVARQVPGMTRSMISLLEHGRRDLAVVEAFYLAGIYHVSVGWLCGAAEAHDTDLNLNGLGANDLAKLAEYADFLRFRSQGHLPWPDDSIGSR